MILYTLVYLHLPSHRYSVIHESLFFIFCKLKAKQTKGQILNLIEETIFSWILSVIEELVSFSHPCHLLNSWIRYCVGYCCRNIYNLPLSELKRWESKGREIVAWSRKKDSKFGERGRVLTKLCSHCIYIKVCINCIAPPEKW